MLLIASRNRLLRVPPAFLGAFLELGCRDACSDRLGWPYLRNLDVDIVHAVPHLRAQPLRASHLW